MGIGHEHGARSAFGDFAALAAFIVFLGCAVLAGLTGEPDLMFFDGGLAALAAAWLYLRVTRLRDS